jgi:hypothetical protein
VPKAQLLPPLLGAALDHRLERLLRDEQALGGAQVPHALVHVRHVALQLIAGDALDRQNGAVRIELLKRFLPHDLLDTEAAHHLHRALVDERRPGVDRRAGVPLSDDGLHAQPPQEGRHEHADQASADDQDRDFGFFHGS